MKVLVTGATGFIGGHLTERLVREGFLVRALVRPATDTRFLRRLDVELARGDLEDPGSLEPAVADCEIVFHLAAARAAGGVGHSGRRETDVEGTERLARLAARAGARFVFASSRGVHGATEGVLDERTPLAPNTHYRRTKVEAEACLARCVERNGLRLVVLRLPSVIGPGGRGWLGLFRAVGTGRFRTIGGGRNLIHPCPVDDAVKALLLGGQVPGVDGETYLFSGRDSIPLRAFLESIARHLGVSLSPVRLPRAPYLGARKVWAWRDRALGRPARLSPYEIFLVGYEIDHRKARSELGYDPTSSLDDAIHRSVDWFREEGLL
jgi:nucleoside-diphosphate-sugar epimerase